jgi:ABC-type uncharacterized transport system substrate-binding protein
MEQFYKISQKLTGDSKELTNELFKYNPSFEGNNGKKSLATLAGMARELQYKYEDLTNDLIRKHERNRKNGFSSSS